LGYEHVIVRTRVGISNLRTYQAAIIGIIRSGNAC
jgi:hypothetical protein